MPLYNMRNKETKEVKEMFLSLSERETFLLNNPVWEQVPSIPGIVSGVKSALARTDDGWKEVLKSVKKGSGRNNTINT